MDTKRKSLLMAVITLVLCLSMIATGTYALFSTQVKLTNHLSAGQLNVTLTRTKLTALAIDTETGYFIEKNETTPVPLTQASNDNVFGMGQGEIIAPKCYYTAELKLENKGDVAVDYWVEIIYTGSKTLDVAKQVKLTVVGDKTESSYLCDASVLGSQSLPIGTLAINNSKKFTMTILFEDLSNGDNNLAQAQDISFDLLVHVVQSTTVIEN
jgi:hypothetical protein